MLDRMFNNIVITIELFPEKQSVFGNAHLKTSTLFNFDQLKLKEIVSRKK